MISAEPPARAGAGRPARPWLLADIGGTNARFGWLGANDSRVAHVSTLRGADHAGPAAAARAYLDGLSIQLGRHYQRPRGGAFAVATALCGDEVALTNSGWSFSRQQVQAELQLATLLVLNDFEALALSLPHLGAAQLRPHGALPQARGTLAVVGPGTGLGVAGVVQTANGWAALAGEGGHATLAAGDDFENAVLAAVRLDHTHVSAERLLSGIGLPVLHRAVAAVLGLPSHALSAELIVERGLAGSDPACSRSLDAFCALLGGFCGNVVLTLGARGGLYIGGGIVPRLGERFFQSNFRDRFEAKGRFQPYLQAVPTALITDTLAALTGASQALEQHQP